MRSRSASPCRRPCSNADPSNRMDGRLMGVLREANSKPAADADCPERVWAGVAGDAGADPEVELGVVVQQVGQAAVQDQGSAAAGIVLRRLQPQVHPRLEALVRVIG